MLSQKNRLNRRVFDKIFTGGRFVSGPSFSAKIAVLPSQTGGPRFAVVIAKKHLPRAVDRHRLRRRVYDVIGGLIGQLRPGFAMIVLVKPELTQMAVIDLSASLKAFFKQQDLFL